MDSVLFFIILVLLIVVFGYMLYAAFKWSKPKKVKHPTVWQQYLERERRKQEDRDRE